MDRMTTLIAATVAAVLLIASPAGADIKHGRDWAFGASHYTDDVSTRRISEDLPSRFKSSSEAAATVTSPAGR